MRRLHVLALGLPLAALLAAPAIAQQPKPDNQGANAAPHAGGGMHGMMASCGAEGKGHASLKADVVKSLARVREAKAGNAAAATAALADAERTLAAVEAHFTTCDSMMEKMKGGAATLKADEHKH
jgi:hypothetical protein